MPAKSTKRQSGGAWLAATGQKAVGLTLEPDESAALRVLAAQCGPLSAAEFSRRLVRWALRKSQSAAGLGEIKKIAESA